MAYEIRKIDPNSWHRDSDGVCHTVYEQTLATANTWRELMRKSNDWWYVGKGADIFRNGEKIGHTEDLVDALYNRYDDRTGRQLPVRLRDFVEAAVDKK